MGENLVLLRIRSWLVLTIITVLASPQAWAGQGWYLLYPQVGVSPQAPLKLWTQMQAYDTAKECEEGLVFHHNLSLDRLRSVKDKDRKTWERILDAMAYLRCIASDDPRLK